MKRNRIRAIDRFAGFIHWFNVFLKPARGSGGAELAVAIY